MLTGSIHQDLAFCDIDLVNRELMYLKLDSLGFGGRVKALIQSMYFNDNIRVQLCRGLSRPLWFTRGIKQGCVLSPMLFSLYVSGLGKVLHSMNEGVQFNGVTITALFFADYLLLISRTKCRGMSRISNAVQRFCVDMDMKLAVVNSGFKLWNKPECLEGFNPDIEATLVARRWISPFRDEN